MENGSREIINQLHTANRLIPELLNIYAVEDAERGRFFARVTIPAEQETNGREHLCSMDPGAFENLIADYFLRRGFVHADVIGRSGDRGVHFVGFIFKPYFWFFRKLSSNQLYGPLFL